MPHGVTVNSIAKRLDEWDRIRSQIDQSPGDNEERAKKVQILGQKTDAIVKDLSRLTEPERLAIGEALKQKKPQALVAFHDFVAKNDDQAKIFNQVLGKEDWQNLSAVAANEAKRGAGTAVTTGPMGMEAVLAGVREAKGGKVTLKPDTKAKRDADPELKQYLAGFAAAANAHETLIKAGEAHLADYKKAVQETATPEQKAAAQKTIAEMQAQLDALKANKVGDGILAAGIVDDPLFTEVVAHALKLPSSLNLGQRKYLDSLTPPTAERLDRLTTLVGGKDSPIGQLVGAVASGDQEAQSKAVKKMLGIDEPPPAAEPDAPGPNPKVNTAAASKDDLDLAKGNTVVAGKLSWLRQNHPHAWDAVTQFYTAQETNQRKAMQIHDEIMSLLNSGLPIEMIIMLVMLKLTERQEDKFQLKVKELGAAEQIDNVNRPIEEKIASLKQMGRFDEAEKLQEHLVRPLDFGIKTKSTTMLMQEMQVEMQTFMQIMQALAGVLREVQDMVMTPVRNIRS